MEKEERCNRCRKILCGTTVCVATASVATVTVFLDMEDGGDGRVTVRLPVLQQSVLQQSQCFWIWRTVGMDV